MLLTIWGSKTGWQAHIHRHRLFMPPLNVQWQRQMTEKESNARQQEHCVLNIAQISELTEARGADWDQKQGVVGMQTRVMEQAIVSIIVKWHRIPDNLLLKHQWRTLWSKWWHNNEDVASIESAAWWLTWLESNGLVACLAVRVNTEHPPLSEEVRANSIPR
jgi:hypothetical protein